MKKIIVTGALLPALLALSSCSTMREPAQTRNPITFALIGDIPYSEHDAKVSFPNMIEEINRAGVAFTVHDGDIKNGGILCSSEILDTIHGQFQSFDRPMVYLFGDNEWTDCARNPTNNLSQEQWLGRLRDVFCQGDQSLGQHPMRLTRQSETKSFSKFRENVRWTLGNVVFVGLNVPGDSNNFGQKNEYTERNRANLDWIKEGFELAKSTNARAVMLLLQANPHIELASTNRLRAGFKDMMSLIEKETIAFKKPVVFVHGDSHYFRIDKPLIGSKSKRRVENFTRVETFGNPDCHWLHVTIDEKDPEVFIYRPRIVEKNLVKQD